MSTALFILNILNITMLTTDFTPCTAHITDLICAVQSPVHSAVSSTECLAVQCSLHCRTGGLSTDVIRQLVRSLTLHMKLHYTALNYTAQLHKTAQHSKTMYNMLNNTILNNTELNIIKHSALHKT